MSEFYTLKSSVIRTSGLVIRGHDYGEGRCMYTVLTKDYGRIAVDSSQPKGKYFNKTPISVGSYMTFILKKQGKMHWIKESEYNDQLIYAKNSLETWSLTSYILDVAYELTADGEDCADILAITYNSLYALSYKSDIPVEQVKAAFEIKVMAVSGYMPSVNKCEVCGNLDSSMYLDVMNGGVICTDCLRKREKEIPYVDMDDQDYHAPTSILCPLTPDTICAIYYVICAPYSKMLSFRLDDEEELRILNKATSTYLINHLERNFDSLDYYNSIREDIAKEKKNRL
jgi:DNA repair protein RecO (recombination protein O)